MNLLSQSAVPRRLSDSEMAPFEARFSSANDVNAQVSHLISTAIPPSTNVYKKVSAFLSSAQAMDSQIARDAKRIGDHHLLVIFNAIANAGLHAFAPDVFGNVESMYNLLHEHLAIHTFRSVASAWAYSSLCPVTTRLLNDYNLLRSFYRSFVYGYLRELARKEDLVPGRVVQSIANNNTYRRREELLGLRATQIADDCFSIPVTRLVAETDCHSDDEEPAPGSREYRIHEKEGRDAAVTNFFRIITTRSEASRLSARRRGRWIQRTRVPGLEPSEISRTLPIKVPIDYFSPEFFNSLSVRQRAAYMGNGVALPIAHHCQTWADIEQWKGLATADFMARYGNAKLALYNLPTAAELARLESNDASLDDD
ncbi:hypothetical protein C8R44DRAFT_893803 [Mycena epipterygia]|nr:hypothetical protein C8R44DRAFT_893803 [Mycena epipterygia]